MQTPDTWQTVVIIIGGVLALAAAINTVGSATEKIVKAWRASRAPDDAQNERIAALEATTLELQREAEKIQARLDKRDNGMIILYEAIIALLGHGIDGNNVSEMKDVKRKIETYLINK